MVERAAGGMSASDQLSCVSHSDATQLEERVDTRLDYKVVAKERKNGSDERRRMTRRSKSRSVERDEREKQQGVNETTPLALNHIVGIDVLLVLCVAYMV